MADISRKKAEKPRAKNSEKAKVSTRKDAGSYHHGGLRMALIEAAAGLIEAKGLEGFSLRECAKMVGVSPAAPAHHFGSAAGLLEAVATEGFVQLSKRMEAAREALGADAPVLARIMAMIRAYLDFARSHQGLFKVTFGGTVLPSATDNIPLITASESAFGQLMNEVSQLHPMKGRPDTVLSRTFYIWSFVHGLADLTVNQRMNFLKRAETEHFDVDELIAAVLAQFEHRLITP